MSAIRTVEQACEIYEQRIKDIHKNYQADIEKVRQEERERAATIAEDHMEDDEFWQPIASKILGKVITRKK